MPNSHMDDEKLSSLLSESEPPRSPKHLDESILSYARQQAEKNRLSARVNKQSYPNKQWYRQSWVPAAATFSIAAIAITVTLQNFGPEDFERGMTELASQPEFALRDDLPVVVENTVEIRQRTIAEPSPEEPALASVQTQRELVQSLQADDAATSLVEADQITEVAQENTLSQIETAVSTTEAEDEAVSPVDADNNNSGASLAVTDTPAATTPSVESTREVPDQAPSVPRPQQSASAQIQDLSGTRDQRQRTEENVSAAIASNVGIAEATDDERPEPDSAPADGVTANQNVEEVVVTGSFIRSPARSASVASTVAPTITDLAQMLRSDPDAQQDFLSLLEQSLNQANSDITNSTQSSSRPSSRSTSIFSGLLNRVVQTDSDDLARRREQLIDSYERIGDPGQFLNIANQYRQLLPGYPNLQAPQTLETAMALLELLNQ